MKRLISFLLLASLVVGCAKPDSNDQNGSGNSSAGENVHVTFSSIEDSDDLIFEWERVDADAATSKKNILMLSDGSEPLYGRFSSESNSGKKYSSYSKLTITPREEDARQADFESVDYYIPAELAKTKYCYVVSGTSLATEDARNLRHSCRVEMPATFTQNSDNDPGFLREYMFMYAAGEYKAEETTLNFSQIPALLTFNVKNATSRTMSLQEVYLSVESKENVASQFADLSFGWTDGQADLSYDPAGHDVISVSVGEGVVLAPGKKYTAYSLALPLVEKDAFKGKTVNVSVKCGDFEYVALQLSGEMIAQMNGSDTYNWVEGKKYEIEVNLDKDLEASGQVLPGNTLELTSNFLWTYTLMYENASGQPLTDYVSLCTLPVEQTTYYRGFIDQNIAPFEAETIGLYDSEATRVGCFQTADLRPAYSDVPLYTFGLLSDVHIGSTSANKADADFENALNFFNENNVTMTCICGDITQNGTEKEYKNYAAIAAKSTAPIYATTGNHDCTKNGIAIELWDQYVGLPLVFEKTVETNGRTDHFLFLGMKLWNFTEAYYDEHIDWLEEKLEEYRNDRCFVITHLFFPDRAGNMNGVYPSGNWLKGQQLSRLKAMCDHYVNTLWFSGHSHWKWSLQEYQDRANIYRTYSGNQPASGWCVHVPSCAEPITSDGTTRVSAPAESEGALVRVYENHIEILGMDLLNRKYIPLGVYRLDTSLQNVPEKTPTEEPDGTHYITAKDFSHNVNKNEGATVADVEGMPNYVDVTFTGAKQGFHVYNSTFTSAATGAEIIFEDVQAFSNGTQVDLPEKVGFYSKSGYYLTSTNSAVVYTDAAYPGVHFHTSSSYTSPLPITIRMKAQVEFY